MGMPGSGKSKLLNCIAGIEKPNQGKITRIGTTVHANAQGQYITYLIY
jgi:ABC-type sulfate/molybdate transport systems ATPase subunit